MAGGPDLLQEIGRRTVFESMSKIIKPMVAVVVVIAGSNPAHLFARLGQLAGSSVKNVNFGWTSTGRTTGTLVVTYPMAVPDFYPRYWFGAFDFVYETTRKQGLPTQVQHTGGVLRFDVSWAS